MALDVVAADHKIPELHTCNLSRLNMIEESQEQFDRSTHTSATQSAKTVTVAYRHQRYDDEVNLSTSYT